MSGDVPVRKRNKDKKKDKKKDSIDQPFLNTKRFSVSADEDDAPGVHAGVASENMHEQAHEHGVGWCAKIIFFLLMAILGGLICLIMLENRGGSDLDTPLSESRFSEYLQGWVDEVREDDHHHDEVTHDPYGGHDDSDDLPEDSPYPEEKDNSENDTEETDQDLSAEVNANDNNDSTQEDDGVQSAEEELSEQEAENEPIEEAEEIDEQTLEEDDDEDDDNLPFEEEFDEDNDDSFEEIVDNDAGEDLLLQKIAEQENQSKEEAVPKAAAPKESSQIPSPSGGQSYSDELKKYNENLQNNY